MESARAEMPYPENIKLKKSLKGWSVTFADDTDFDSSVVKVAATVCVYHV